MRETCESSMDVCFKGRQIFLFSNFFYIGIKEKRSIRKKKKGFTGVNDHAWIVTEKEHPEGNQGHCFKI